MNFVQPIRDPEIIEGIQHYLKLRSIRNYLFFTMGIYSGLRVSDLRQLRAGMVRGKTHVYIREKKTKKEKRFIIHPAIRPELERYIEKLNDNDYLFPSRQIKKKSKLRKQPLDRSSAYKMLNKAARQFGLTEIGTHTMRKTWGYHLYMKDRRNLALLMEMFNHDQETTTLRYIGFTQDMMDAAILELSYP
ncbi:tyrosine-type recombinase/integrase [Paenibacillus thermotolerans]|uniref:tyrosine-type recombinase/integrase n=1 Tax=Paenibacillus thermotolerans TaxID=3027807 RepID=UPI002368EA31|nr:MULTISPECIES: tyrosine-type recombinase/integrase [unclassified Paenibacillus]